MPIEFNCTQCGSLLRTPDETAGMQAKCPQCGTVMPIPLVSKSEASADTPVESPVPGNPFGNPPVLVPPTQSAGAENPYQSPPEPTYTTSYAPPPVAPLVPQRFEIGEVLSRSFEIFKAQLGMSVLAIVVVMGMNYAFSLLQNIVIMLMGLVAPPAWAVVTVQVVFSIVGWLFQQWIGIGQTLFFLRTARGNPATLSDLFRGAPYLLRILAASLLLMLLISGLVALALLPAGIVWLATRDQEAAIIAAVVGGIIVIIPVAILGLMFSQFQYLIVDRQMGVLDSLAVSRQITGGNKLMLFATGLLLGVINLAGFLACCVGMLFSMSFSAYVIVVAYLTMTGQPIWAPPTYQPPVTAPPLPPA
jgi:hypothetical protein